uniref:Transmembrane serine protease 2 n=1 Tax=Labrus bergylta TaxID=56723 RepID=A0A3Q3F7H5_9LABR
LQMQHITCNNNDHVAFTFNTHTVSLIPHQSLPLSPLVSHCVWESQWCDGVMDCPAGQDEANCVRVHGSSFLLQIYSSQSKNWRTVCSRGWSDLQGKASCRQIGYSRQDSQTGFSKKKSVFVSDCGTGVNSSRASGGQPASLGSWPWQVSLQVAGSHRCGGAVISPYWIVTAADCVASVSSPGDWAVYAGVVEPLGTLFNPSYSVSHVIAHEGYNSFTLKSDIALMRLSKPLDHTVSSHIGPVCLPNVGVNITDDQKGWISRFSDSGSPYLMEAQVSLVDAADCNSSTAYNGRITQDMLCAREVEASGNIAKSFSQTDSGSPLVALKDGVWWLIGDCIRGQDCTEHQRPGVYGKIPFFLDWIFQQMRVIKDTD